MQGSNSYYLHEVYTKNTKTGEISSTAITVDPGTKPGGVDGSGDKSHPIDIIFEKILDVKREKMEQPNKEKPSVQHGLKMPVTQMAHAEALAVTSETGSPSPSTSSITQPGDTVNGSIAGMDGIMPPGGGEIGASEGRGQAGAQRHFGSKTAQKSYAIDEETKTWLRNNSGYAQDSNRAQIDRAIETIEQKGYDAAKNEWLDKDIKEMNNADGHAMGAILMGIAARNGDVAAEIAVANKYNELGTVSGQSLQARKIFNMMTPLGAASYVQGLVDSINNRYYRQNKGTKVAVSDDTMSAIVGAESTEARQAAVDKAQSEIAAQMPPSWKDRLTAWRYLSMLGNPRTHIRNVLGNAVFAPVVAAKNKVGAAMEAIAQKAGWIDARTKTGKLVVDKPLRDFAKADAQTRRDVLTGEAKYNTESKIDRERRSFGNSKVGNALQWLVDQNGKALEAEDWLFLSGHYERALGGYLQANNLNPSTMTQAELDAAREYAIKEAQKATYRDTSSFVEALNRFSKSNKGAAFLVESVLPFKKTPVNILKRGLEYSPVGFLNTLAKWGKQCYQMNKAERGGRNAEDFRTMTANEFIDGLASGLTGTMAMGLGYLLSSLGIITAGIDDDKEGDFEKLTGEQAYSIKIGNMSFTVDWMTPIAMPVLAGAELFKAANGQGDFLRAILSMSEPTFNLSMLDGINSAIESARYAETNPLTSIAINAATNFAGQFIPTILGQIARSIDPVRRTNVIDKDSQVPRDVQYFLNRIQNKLPGLSMLSQPYVNPWGEQEVTESVWLRVVENFLSPGYISKIDPDDTEKALMALAQEVGQDVYPTLAKQKFTVNGMEYTLKPEEYTAFKTSVGQRSKEALDSLFANQEFLSLPDAYKAKAIHDAYTYAAQTSKAEIAQDATVYGWVKDAQRAENPASVLVEQAQKAITEDYVKAYSISFKRGVLEENPEAVQTSLAALKESGMDDKKLKTKAGDLLRDIYKEAWRNNDIATCRTIEAMLAEANIGFKVSDFAIWQKKAEEKDE